MYSSAFCKNNYSEKSKKFCAYYFLGCQILGNSQSYSFAKVGSPGNFEEILSKEDGMGTFIMST